MTPDNRPANPHAPDPDRENLSALFDGELQGDAARFAMRRLDHDAHWRDACGRWQLLGDVLRGQGCAQAPSGFATRVEHALAAESAGGLVGEGASAAVSGNAAVAAAAPARRARHWSRSRIGGAALAASVAFAALLVVRPGFDDAPAPAADESPALATTPAAPAATVASVPQVSPSQPAVEASTPEPAVPGSETGLQTGLAAAAVAVAELPRRARSQSQAQTTRSQSQRAGMRAARQRQTETQAQVQVANAPPPVSRLPATTPVEGARLGIDSGMVVATAEPSPGAGEVHPFQPRAEEIPSRPWPRATLPDYPASGAFTASYDSAGAASGSQSFYPFEPRVPQQLPEMRILDARAIQTRTLEPSAPPQTPPSQGPRP